jgi:hypothetical protein
MASGSSGGALLLSLRGKKQRLSLAVMAVIASALLPAMTCTRAHANSISVAFDFAGSNVPLGLFKYDISIASSSTVPNSTVGPAVPSSIGGDLFDNFTIYDFQYFGGVVFNNTGFTFVPGGTLGYGARSPAVLPPDTAVLPNLIFKNTAPGGVVVSGPALLGSVILKSSAPLPFVTFGYWTSKDSGSLPGGPPVIPTFGDGPLPVAGSGDFPVPTPTPAAATGGLVLLGFMGSARKRLFRS